MSRLITTFASPRHLSGGRVLRTGTGHAGGTGGARASGGRRVRPSRGLHGARRWVGSPVQRKKLALLLALAGVLCLTTAGAVFALSRPGGTVGAAAELRLASAAPSAEPSVGASVPVLSGALPTDSVVPPARLVITKIGLNARVTPVGVQDGDFAVPPSVDVVGWYKFGPGLEATAGSIVVAGHVDSAQQGQGAFFKLRDLGPGDRITVTGTDGRVYAFGVVAREIYSKQSIPLDRYFARDGAPRLTLITCGGPFDATTRHYRDNVVVTAQPLSK